MHTNNQAHKTRARSPTRKHSDKNIRYFFATWSTVAPHTRAHASRYQGYARDSRQTRVREREREKKCAHVCPHTRVRVKIQLMVLVQSGMWMWFSGWSAYLQRTFLLRQSAVLCRFPRGSSINRLIGIGMYSVCIIYTGRE